MIQILGLRSFVADDGKKKTYDAFFKEGYKAQNIKEVLASPDELLKQVPKEEHWNLFYTLSNCTDKKRGFASQDVMPFDIDGLDLNRVSEYIEIVTETLGVEKDGAGIVHSGNGLHFLIGLKTPIKTAGYFKKNLAHYKAVADKINLALSSKDLPGTTDSSAFQPRRLFRFPNTQNRKKDKETKTCRVINGVIKDVDFNIRKLSGIPDIKEKDQLPIDFLKKFPKVDHKAVLTNCEFLRHVRANPNDISEPQWYAALTITSRFEKPDEASCWISEGYKGFSKEETLAKMNKALESSGPRTCANIDTLWNGCKECPNYEKVKSPILLKSEDHIPTEDTGFRHVSFDEKGKMKIGAPDYKDVCEFFDRQHKYILLGESRECLVWTDNHYQKYGTETLNNFALEHIKPEPVSKERDEFRKRIYCTHIKEPEWFLSSTDKKINFQNGVLDLKTLDFLPHDPSCGFRYILPYDYDEDATAPHFEQMLEDITGSDQSLKNILTEFGGYCLSNDTCWLGKALVLVGEGSNGKSTFMNMLRKLAGGCNYSSLSLSDLKSEYSRQLIDGKLFNLAEETPNKSLLESSIFKNLVTGGEVQVRSPYKLPYFMRNKAKLMFSCNELPESADTTHGFFRRLLIVPFDQQFNPGAKNFDPFIEQKLSNELPGIFNLMLEGYKRLKENEKFTHSSKVDKQLKDYQNETDSVLMWVSENIVVHDLGNGHDKDYATIHDLYHSYQIQVRNGGINPVNINSFGKKIAKYIDKYQERFYFKKVDSKSVKVIKGISYNAGSAM